MNNYNEHRNIKLKSIDIIGTLTEKTTSTVEIFSLHNINYR